MAELQTKVFTSETVNTYYLALTVSEESINPDKNESHILYSLTLYSGGSSFNNYGVGHIISLGGNVVSAAYRGNNAPQCSIASGKSLLISSGEVDMPHNSDGTLNMPISFSVSTYETSYTPGDISVSNLSMTLTPISVASGIGATDANIGSTSVIAISKRDSSYSHSIKYEFGTLSGYIGYDGSVSTTEQIFTATSLAWKIPISFYNEIPTAKTGSCVLTCTTYSGNKKIGEPQSTEMTVRTSYTDCMPSVSGTVEDVNEQTLELTGSSKKLIRFYSKAYCIISAEAKKASTIVARTVNGMALKTDRVTFENVETGNFVFFAKDSRGYASEINVVLPVVPYIKLTNNSTIERTDPTSGNATLNVYGEFYNGSFGAQNNSVSVTYKVGSGGSEVSVPAETNGNSYNVSTTITGLDYTKSHTITITVSDKLSSAIKKLTVKKGIPVFDWGENDFRFNVPVAAPSISVDTLTSENEIFAKKLSVGTMDTLQVSGRASVQSLSVGGKNEITSYITQQSIGTDYKVWYYKKYSDGSCDLWMVVPVNGEAIRTVYGSLCRTIELCASPESGEDPYKYPFTVYSPHITFSFNPAGNNQAGIWVCNGGTESRGPTFYLIANSAIDSISGTISIFVHGLVTGQ